MSVLADWEIKQLAEEKGMIEPFLIAWSATKMDGSS
jgi:hypothetical protein